MASNEALRQFVYTIQGSVDHAGMKINNKGSLWKPYDGDLDHVKFPAPLGALLPQGIELSDEYLTITARDWYGRGRDSLAFWLETKSRPGWEMPAITGRFYDSGDTPSILIANEQANEEVFLEYVSSYMSLLPDLPSLIAINGMGIAFRHGINYIAESGIALSSIKKRSGEKTAPSGRVMNGFQIHASTMEVFDQDGEKTIYETHLIHSFEPLGDDRPYGGHLNKAIKITIQDGEITDAIKESSINLMDTPFIDGETVNAYSDGSAVDREELPQQLTDLLYEGSEVEEQDIAYFTKLMTKPLKEKDINIL